MQKIKFVSASSIDELETKTNSTLEELEKTAYINSVVFLGKTPAEVFKTGYVQYATTLVDEYRIMINYSMLGQDILSAIGLQAEVASDAEMVTKGGSPIDN